VADLVPAPAGAGLRLGAVGLAIGSAVGAWFELVRLVRGLRRGGSGGPRLVLPGRALARMGALAASAAVPATLLWRWLPPLHPALTGLLVIGLYVGVYLGGAALARFPEMERWTGRLLRKLRRPRP
jgi:putative peptidoglycan lipid II flippase